MSYARFGEDSDVYVFASVGGHLECCGCALEAGEPNTFGRVDDLLAHLEVHAKEGDAVPDYCIERLNAEKDELDAWLAEEAKSAGVDLDEEAGS